MENRLEVINKKLGVRGASHNWLNLVLVGVMSLLLLIFSHDVSWWPKDDGVFGHLAERVLNGDVYGVDVYDFHGGYHTFLNALMFHWFGVDVVVLRYPLIVLGMIQAMLVTHMLRHLGTWLSIIGGLFSIIGLMMFPNPSPNWYALFFTIVSIWILTEFKSQFLKYLALGVVIGLCFMFRHPSAIFLSMGVLTYLLYESRTVIAQSLSAQIISKTFLGLVGLGIIIYSQMVFEPFAFVIFAAPPLVFLYFLSTLKTYDLVYWLRKVSLMCIGGVAAVLPMVVYQLQYGNVISWIQQSFLTGPHITEKAFFSDVSYIGFIISIVVNNVLSIHWSALVLYSFLWAGLFLLPIVLFYKWFRYRYSSPKSIHPAVFVATFYGLVSFYFEITFYFFISFAVFVLAVGLSYSLEISRFKKSVISGLIFVFFILSLTHVPAVATSFSPSQSSYSKINKVSLLIKIKLQDEYQEILTLISANSKPGGKIYVFPFDPDIYFSSERKNPFPFIGSSMIVTDQDSYESLVSALEQDPPTLFVFNSGNKYKSNYDLMLLDYLQTNDNYELVAEKHEYFIFSQKE